MEEECRAKYVIETVTLSDGRLYRYGKIVIEDMKPWHLPRTIVISDGVQVLAAYDKD